MCAYAPKILVVGSLVMDLITSTEKLPAAGETVIGCGFSTAPGGKGANQAYQAAKLGAKVSFVGKVGNDVFGDELISSLKSVGVDTSHIVCDPATYSAVGTVQLLKKNGRTLNNRIVVAPGGNYCLNESDVSFLKEEIGNYDIVLLQLEVPQKINELVASWAAEKGVPVMLNPAPSAPLSNKLLSSITYISPNEYEAADLTGIDLHIGGNQIDCDKLDSAASELHNMGIENVLITLGKHGCYFSSPECTVSIPCVPNVNAIDPTAAGDSFMGAFCTGRAIGLTPKDALIFATHTSAITVSGMGAQPSLPSLAEVLSNMQNHGCSKTLTQKIKDILGGGNYE